MFDNRDSYAHVVQDRDDLLAELYAAQERLQDFRSTSAYYEERYQAEYERAQNAEALLFDARCRLAQANDLIAALVTVYNSFVAQEGYDYDEAPF